MEGRNLAELETRIGYRFKDISLLEHALRHSSATTELLANNERLEYLGDAVVSLVVAHYLFETYPQMREGNLTQIKAYAVCTDALGRQACNLGLPANADLGRSLCGSGNTTDVPASVAANLFEAVAAAIYLDGGLAAAHTFTLNNLQSEIDHMLEMGHDSNFKSLLQFHCQHQLKCMPRYKLLNESGPDHQKRFTVQVHIQKDIYPSASGTSKKEAEQAAAENALAGMSIHPDALVQHTKISETGEI